MTLPLPGACFKSEAATEIPIADVKRSLHRGGVYPYILGGRFASFIVAVSENYAREIMTDPVEDERTGWVGTAFAERGIRLQGVTNGVEPSDYDPRDPGRMKIAAGYDPASGDLTGKQVCRQALIREVWADETPCIRFVGHLVDSPERPLVVAVTRLVSQKGIDRLIAAVRLLLGGADTRDALVLVLGTGERVYEEELSRLAREFRGRVAVGLGRHAELANRVYAAGDFFVNSAEFAPCETTDFNALLMGVVPVVHRVGGLVKIRDGVNGYTYDAHSAEALAAALRAAIDAFRTRRSEHVRLIQQGIRLIHDRYTTDRVLERSYLPLYERAITTAPGRP